MSKVTALPIQEIINKIFSIKDKYITVSAQITLKEINFVLNSVQEILISESSLLELHASITLVGDTHGQLHDLLRIFDKCGYPPTRKYLFLGDYVDRGFRSIETIILLFCYKILYPDKIFLIRGNHETPSVNTRCGFKSEIHRYYKENCFEIWSRFNEVFNLLSISALIDDKIFCIHGGISHHLTNFQEIRDIQKPIDENLIFNGDKSEIMIDFLWAEANSKIENWKIGSKRKKVTFGLMPLENFIKKFNLKMVCRGHEVANEGTEFPFFPNQTFFTIFSAPKFKLYHNNKAAVAHFDENLDFTVTVFEPKEPYLDQDSHQSYLELLERKSKKSKKK